MGDTQRKRSPQDAAQHTPGPWTWLDEDMRIVGGDGGTVVCEVTGSRSNPESQADAQLIALAPEMLEALRYCAGWLSSDDSVEANTALARTRSILDRASRGTG